MQKEALPNVNGVRDLGINVTVTIWPCLWHRR